MIELFIETLKIQKSSRIIEIKSKFDPKVEIKEIQSSNMKEKRLN